MRGKTLGVLLLAVTMVVTGCTSDDEQPEDDVIVISTPEPAEPLTPATVDDAGEGILDQLYAGLAVVDEEGRIQLEVAETIESEDFETWTITVADGWEFSDGTPVTAQSFADAWVDAAANGPGDVVDMVFGDVRGITAVRQGEADAFSGVTVEGETITVQLVQADADFPARLAHRFFFPRSEGDLGAEPALGHVPVGNGPYVAVGDGWDTGSSLGLVVNDDYDGARVPRNEGLRFVFHEELDDAFAALEDGDVHVIVGATLPDDADGDGLTALKEPGSALQSLMIPEWLPRFGGEEGVLRRRAVSLAIDREAIIEEVFAGLHTPAADFTTPLLGGFRDDLEATEFLAADPDRALRFWEQAEDIEEWEGALTLAYNADGGHAAWLEPMAEQISEALGIEVELQEFEDYEALAEAVIDRDEDAVFRIGWQGEFPSALDYLVPRFTTGAASNGGDYSYEGVDSVLAEAAQTDDPAEQDDLIARAQQRLLSDLPAVPLWYIGVAGVAAEDVEGVRATWSGSFEFSAISRG